MQVDVLVCFRHGPKVAVTPPLPIRANVLTVVGVGTEGLEAVLAGPPTRI